ncbi:kinase [Promicromonospora xylanilytica]
MTGNDSTRLVILRGPSGSGKSTVARELRERMGRGTALIEQDYVRRKLLWEKDTPGAVNISMIDTLSRHALDAGCSVVMEGILHEVRYGGMLRALVADHQGISVAAYLDVPFDETLRRHAGRPQAAEFTPELMAQWWAEDDRLRVAGEIVIGPRTAAQEIVDRLLKAQLGLVPEGDCRRGEGPVQRKWLGS